VEFIAAAGDDVLHDHLASMAGNATYPSPTIQNEMINIIGKSILEAVVSQEREAGIFSVLMDETTNASHQEQASVMVRFVDTTVQSILKLYKNDYLVLFAHNKPVVKHWLICCLLSSSEAA
jgi:Domain of unknown function (DUF4371)